MAQEPLNSPNNTNLPHGGSFWFQDNFAGDHVEFGDLVVDEVTAAPEFLEHFSYRNGLRALRKRLLTQKAASISLTLNEPNIFNFQRVMFGGTVETAQTATFFESREATVLEDTDGDLYVDMDVIDEDATLANITVTAIYDKADPTQSDSYNIVNASPDANGKVVFNEKTDQDFAVAAGETVNVVYQISQSGMQRTEIYGADQATVDGAAQLQFRNQSGGIQQLWDIASVQLSPNGGIPFPLDAIQTIPLLATLQERGGTFGHIYTA